MIMVDQFINFVIRPPRADYNPDQYLWDRDFTLAGRAYKRKDLELKNSRGQNLKCSHYVPSPYSEDTPLPCVVYCHGNSGCRADANEAAVVLLPLNITLFTLDFSGSGLSDGDYVSLGWHEKDDLKAVVSYLRSNKQVSDIGLWGRSMGAVTSLLYGSEDPSISGMVLDSAFSNLFDLMMEFVDVYKIRLPKFTVKLALQYMRRVIQKKANFDIMDLNCTQVASKTFIPALFGHADEDKFIQPHHSDLIYKLYSGGKNIIKFSGDHNSSRPQLFYDSVSIFFYNTLYHPQQVSSSCSNKLQMDSKLKDLQAGTAIDESMLYEIIANLRIASTEAASSSSAPTSLSTAKLVGDAFSEIAPISATAETMLEENPASPSDVHFQDANVGMGCCSYSSSARESWDQCSSLGGSDSADCIAARNKEQQESVEVCEASKQADPTDSTKKGKKKKRKKKPTISKKPKSTGFEKLEALGQRIRLHMLKKANLIKRHS